MGKKIQNLYADEQILFNHFYEEYPEPTTYVPHSHDVCELLLLKKGDAHYTTRGRKYKLREDDLIFARPSEIHDIVPQKSSPYERYNILFDEKTLPFDIWKKIPADTDVINFHNVRSVLELFERMDYYRSRLEGAALKVALTASVQEIYVNIVLEMETAKNENKYIQTNDVVCRAIAYIDENLTTLTDIEEVASALFITKSHLHHLFMRHLRISPKKYIVQKRLTLAQREIALGARPTEICRMCGFTDYSAFYRAYRSHFGKSPSNKSDNATLTIDGITHYHSSDE